MIATLFLTLLFAHAIADYPLQTNWVYALKVRHFWGIVLHVLIFTLTSLVFLFLIGFKINISILGFLLFLTVLHIIEDKLKLAVYKGDVFFWYVVDQLIHIACIAMLWALPLNVELLPWYPGDAMNHLLFAGTLVVYASYASSIGIYFFKKSYRGFRGAYQRDWGEILEMGFWAVLFVSLPVAWVITFFISGLLVKGVGRKRIPAKLTSIPRIIIPAVFTLLMACPLA
jgi:hypothetical protein